MEDRRPADAICSRNSDNDAFASSRFSESLLPFGERREYCSAGLGPDWTQSPVILLDPAQAFRCLMVNAARWPAISSGLNGGPVNAPIASRASAGLVARPSAPS